MIDTELKISHITSANYDIICFQGEISVSTLIPVTPKLNAFTTLKQPKDLVFDLSEATSIDSSGIRLIINVDKKVKAGNKKFYILKPHETVLNILNSTNMTKVFTIIDSHETLEKQIQTSIYETYLPYATEEDGFRKLRCSCAVCGSLDVIGYLVDQNSLNWRWVEDDPFPAAYDKSNDTPVEVFGILPIVCRECYMTSIRIADFNILSEDNSVAIKSSLQDESKNLLAKAIKKRKKMMETAEIIPDDFFLLPRTKDALFKIYELAEFCIRTISVLCINATPFEVGYYNYLAIRFAELNAKEVYINNCRTWFTQALQRKEELSSYERALSYFILLVADLNLDKKKEASRFFSELSNLVKELPPDVSTEGINNPAFWHKQAEYIWKKEIEAQSDALKV